MPSQGYQGLGLTLNPFPEPGSIEALESVTIIEPEQATRELQESLERFVNSIRRDETEWLQRNVLERLRRGGGHANAWVSGPKGVGKSILLKHFLCGLRDTSTLPIYVKYPVRGLPEILEMFLRWLGEAKLSQIAHGLYAQFYSEKFSAQNGLIFQGLFYPEIEDRSILNDMHAFFNSKFFRGTLKSFVKRTFNDWLLNERDVPTRIAHLLTNFYETSPEERFSILRRTWGQGSIASVITGLVDLAEGQLGIDGFVLVLDELELLWRNWPKSRRETFSRWLRSLHEVVGESLAIVLTRVPDILQLNDLQLYPSLLEAVPYNPQHVLTLAPLDVHGTSRLMVGYLQGVNGNRGTHPFTEGAIEAVALSTRGIPREILYSCYGLVEEACDKKMDRIDLKMFQSFAGQ